MSQTKFTKNYYAGRLNLWSTFVNGVSCICFCHLIFHTQMYYLECSNVNVELGKIYPLAHPSGPSNVIRDSSVKITPEKSIFIYFLA